MICAPRRIAASSTRRAVMAINPVQFQARLSKVEFVAQYGTEAKCYRAAYRSRWPQGFRCPSVPCKSYALTLPPRRPGVLPVPQLPASDDTDQRYGLGGHEVAADDVVRGAVSAHFDQDELVGAGTQASSGCALSHCLATQAQSDAGDDGTRKNSPVEGFRAGGRRLSGRRA